MRRTAWYQIPDDGKTDEKDLRHPLAVHGCQEGEMHDSDNGMELG